MSEKKPGFFKRLLGALTGKKAEPEEEKPKKEEAKPKAKAAAKKAPAKKPAEKKPGAKKPTAKTTKKPEKSEAKPKAAPKAKAPAKKPAAKKRPAKKKEEAAPPEAAVEVAAPEPELEPVREPEPAPEPPPEPEPAAEEPPRKKGWFVRLKDGLSKTSNRLTENIAAIFTKRKLDHQMLQELEDALIQADLGIDMAMRITEEVAKGRFDKEIAPEEVRAVLGAEVAAVLEPMARPLELDGSSKPHVILVVGVNGTGKTTTIGKLAYQFTNEGKSVVIAAGDTFRAAAIEQLEIWGERAGAPVVSGKIGADAAGLTYDALERAREQEADVLLIDTAGRLQNKAYLMDELAKIVRVLKKLDESAPHSVLLILDATTGQNAVEQARVFMEISGVTGIIMTKLDGTARGGILVAIAEKFALPIHAIGVGETVDDLQPFDAYEFASAIAGAEEKVEA
jgi:fused signal recognition particle receptor